MVCGALPLTLALTLTLTLTSNPHPSPNPNPNTLTRYAGRLLTCDDHTGVVYEVTGGRVVPAYILADGDGHAARTFKCEWAAVRHGLTRTLTLTLT